MINTQQHLYKQAFLESMSKQFRSRGGRHNMLSTMIESIRLDIMNEREEIVSFEEAISVFMSELEEVTEIYRQKDVEKKMNEVIKILGN